MGAPGSYSSGGGSGGFQRPAPKNWADQQDQAAEDAFNSAGQWVGQDRQTAAGDVAGRSAGTGTAYDAFTNWSPSNTKGYSPTELKGYDPASFLASIDPGKMADLGGSRAGGFVASNLSAFDNPNLSKFSSADVTDFDPSAYGKEFAGGAYGDFKNKVGDQLETLQNQDTAAGRLNTGFFDRDRGKVINRLGSDFDNAIAQAATTFSGQKLNALESGAGMRLSQAQSEDANLLARAQGIDTLGERSAEAGDTYALGAADLTERSREFGINTQLDIGKTNADYSYRRAHDIDTLDYSKAHDLDAFGLSQGATGLDAALRREDMARHSYDSAADREASYDSSARNFALQQKEWQDEMDYRDREDKLRQQQTQQAQASDPHNYTYHPDAFDATGQLTSHGWYTPNGGTGIGRTGF